MDTKLTQSNTVSSDSLQKRPKGKGFFAHLEALKEELKKVSWPTQEELRFSTKVVIFSIFILLILGLSAPPVLALALPSFPIPVDFLDPPVSIFILISNRKPSTSQSIIVCNKRQKKMDFTIIFAAK